jgi:hypothetical protein
VARVHLGQIRYVKSTKTSWEALWNRLGYLAVIYLAAGVTVMVALSLKAPTLVLMVTLIALERLTGGV